MAFNIYTPRKSEDLMILNNLGMCFVPRQPHQTGAIRL